MKPIDRSFAMKMLEELTGKPEAQIMAEAAEGKGDWPMGTPELENTLAVNQKFAETALQHFRSRRPAHISREDITMIDVGVNGSRSSVREFELDAHRRKIKAVFDVYEAG